MKPKVQGFTLVELLIVAVVLAIFAAIVVPQFASTTDEARESALKADLAGIRNAIDLYRQQHGHYPGSVTAVPAGTCTGTDGTGTGGAGAQGATALISQLTLYTTSAGQACSTQESPVVYNYGPYLREDSIPTNAVNGLSTITVVNTGDLSMSGDGAASAGWKYDIATGIFIANDTNTDSQGVSYDSY